MAHQLPVLLSPARFKVAVCGRRWGKSVVGLLAALCGHGPYRGARVGAVDGGKIWWVAPSHVIAAEIWRDLKRAAKDGWTHKDEVSNRIELPGGGSVTVRSAVDPESLVAAGLDGVVIDEAAKVKAEAWYGSLRATLSDRRGWGLFIGTPKGFNWVHDLYQFAGQTPGWARWQRPTSDNPLVPASEVEAAKRDSPRFFGQEYEARFEAQEGAEWPPEYFPESIWFSGWPETHLSALALDPAQGKGERGKGCYASFVEARRDSRGCVWVECWASRDWDAKDLAARMVTTVRERKPNGVSTELNGGQEFLADTLFAAAKRLNVHLPLYGFQQKVDKEVRIRSLGSLLAQGRLRIRDTPGGRMLLAQLRDFPVGEYMDCPDACEMACRLLLYLYTGSAGSYGDPALMR